MIGEQHSIDTSPHVILVHGTWPHGLPSRRTRRSKLWFEAGSEFRERLNAELSANSISPPQYHEHTWTGRNSFEDRAQAAISLENRIRDLQAPGDGRPILIVGHSHGGNVAIHALDRINSEKVSIVTMATPFLEIKKGWLDKYHNGLNLNILMAGFILHSVFLILHVIDLTGAQKILLGLTLQVYWAYILREGMRVGELGPKLHTDLEKIVIDTSMSVLQESRVRLLVLRAIDDEASLAIAFAILFSRLSRFISRISLTILLTTCLCLVPTLVTNHDSYFDFLNEIIFYITVSLVLSNVVICMIPGVFGVELFMLNLALKISCQSTPDVAGGHVTIQTVGRDIGFHARFQHRIYDEQSCIEAIASWASKHSFRL